MIDSFSGDHRFLSNFYPCRVRYQGAVYPSTEHAFQAAKSDPVDSRFLCGGLLSAGEAKKLGRKLKLRRDWESVKLRVMRELLDAKFIDPILRAKLLGTGNEELVEGNDWGDRYWGVCRGKGQNHLGKMLMAVRTEIRLGVV